MVIRQHIRVSGVVQGVGFRPFVWRAAQRFECTGWVRNCSAGVEMQLQGQAAALDAILTLLRDQPPTLARIDAISHVDVPVNWSEAGFQILESDTSDPPLALVSPDVATCPACLQELFDPSDRRYLYPFTNCTHCGPRFTIQQSVPYDRACTTMNTFTMCALCAAEYHQPDDRRYHAQPIACHACGPAIWFVDQRSGNKPSDTNLNLANRSVLGSATTTAEAVQAVRSAIASGAIVAIKGIGGFHLACDARRTDVVVRLRQRKQRPFKPLAVMVADLPTVERVVQLSQPERWLLASVQRPIVLLRKRDTDLLSHELAPHNPDLGVLLPYSPLHQLLLQPGDVWVMTSGNLADEPIAIDNSEALERLKSLADCFLLHDRPIHAVCDDSVLRLSTLGPMPIRRSRGYAPLPVTLPKAGPTVLALGGELKNAVCLVTGQHAFMGQHIGDMGNVQSLEAMERSITHLESLYQAEAEVIAVDEHPGYLSTQIARKLARKTGIPTIQVQHHHAHAAALIAEHGMPDDQSIIACVMDGTGYGRDGAIWGGEILIASAQNFERAAHLQYAPLPGGDQCILNPARTALAYLYSVNSPWDGDLACVQCFQPRELKLLKTQLDKQINTVATSSAGRLFDVVAALLDIRQRIDYEGQAAMELEFAAANAYGHHASHESYPCVWTSAWPSQLQLAPLLQAIRSDLDAGCDKGQIAYKFHCTMALAMVKQCQVIRCSHSNLDLNHVGLSGGVFQNALLLELTAAGLSAAGFEVLFHRVVPPNDGGLALGQAVVARASVHL